MLSIAVAERREAPGFRGWSVKQGVLHVQPPADILEGMLTLRLHLSDPPLCPSESSVVKKKKVALTIKNAGFASEVWAGALSKSFATSWPSLARHSAATAGRCGGVPMRPRSEPGPLRAWIPFSSFHTPAR